ncbi:GGDEF domain-containing protein [Nocardia altamirensis]|uniref:GGDEF domain-containing protein n=1 Tax=Nocardia altamirensis TaxID=472158 RepID=UPI0009FE2E17|nr:GGDEF domain-containing protein [Nocardia altamirensis]
MTNTRAMLQTWWRDSVDYDWVVETLESHSALGPLKVAIGAGGIVMVAIAMLTASTQAGATGPVGHALCGIGAVLAGLFALRWWLLPWPREAESLMWIVLLDVGIAANAVVVQNRLLGVLGIILMLSTGGYVTIFHGPRILALNTGWTLLSITVVSVLMVLGTPANTELGKGDFALGVAVVLVGVVAAGLALPMVHFCHWLLRLDSLSDPLTTLPNRRGLDCQLRRFFGPDSRRDAYVVAVDLDQFTSVNATFGHAVGDEVLLRTAESLRAAALPGAVIARTGGDEFTVVGYLRGQSISVTAERLRHAIATMPGLPTTVTASVGAAVAESARKPRTGLSYRTVFCRSDAAMFQAKQLGGNAVVAPGLTIDTGSVSGFRAGTAPQTEPARNR